MGEIPLRKYDSSGEPIFDIDGNPDTSFLAKIPADVPFTFQTIDKDGLALNVSQTWHQVRPGEKRADCGGCHAHSQVGMDFSVTEAAKPTYQIPDLADKTPMLSKDQDGETILKHIPQGAVDVEYYRDIKPILQRSCVQCHSKDGIQEAKLVLDDEKIVDGYENTYHRLANDSNSQYGIPALVTYNNQPLWRQTNSSRYIREFQSRRSLLTWKVFGRRLDGWTNEDHPSPSVPGDAITLPNGGDKKEINRSDIDFRGTICPTPGSGVPSLTEDEKMTVARWIDLGCPINRPDPGRTDFGWFLDELRPTLTVSSPRSGVNQTPLSQIRIGAHDYYTGLDVSSFSVTANFAVNDQPAGTELAPLFIQTGDHIGTLDLEAPIKNLPEGVLNVSIEDNQGNITQIKRSFSIVVDGSSSDEDEDNLPDAWEQQIVDADPNDEIKAIQDVLPEDDFDEDGFANIYESVYHTQPHNRTSMPSATLYVSASASPGGDGSQTKPLNTIQAALDMAGDFDIIEVGDGTYTKSGHRTLDFRGKPVMLMSANGAESCVIDSGGSGGGFRFTSGEDRRSVLRGLTICNGSDPAIFCSSSSPTIQDCTIVDNSITSGGGGIHNYYFSSPMIQNCTIVGNDGWYGGGVYNNLSSPTLKDCTIASNSASNGGAIYNVRSSPTFQNCTIENNSAAFHGGAIYNTRASNPVFESCVIANNRAEVHGGAIHTISSSPTLQNCTVADNNASTGGGIYSLFDSSKPTIRNSILWGNGPDGLIGFRNARFRVTYSDVEGGWPGEGNVNAHPKLNRTYRLTASSPCIDAGDDSDAPIRDIDGEVRRIGSTHPPNSISMVDIGADEFVDTDGDTLPDMWEEQIIRADATDRIRNVEAVQPDDDFDGDALTNTQEFQNGTDPIAADNDEDQSIDGS